MGGKQPIAIAIAVANCEGGDIRIGNHKVALHLLRVLHVKCGFSKEADDVDM